MSATFGSYGEFERAVLDPIREYRRDHDLALLRQSVDVLRAGDALRSPEPSDPPHEGGDFESTYRVVGWVMPQNGIRLRASALRRLNPGYKITVKRIGRRELGRRAQLLRVGFDITATGHRGAGGLQVKVTDRAGRYFDLPASNAEAAFTLRVLRERAAGAVPVAGAAGPLGFIDSVEHYVTATSDQATWLASLVQRHPSEVFEIIDSEVGADLAQHCLGLLKASPTNARWADRYAMSALGAQGSYTSDLVPLTIRRTDTPEAEGDSHGMHMPEATRDGHVVYWTHGSDVLVQPNHHWLTQRDAVVQDGGTLMADGSLVVYENSADPAHGFVAGQWLSVFGAQQNREIALVQTKPAADNSISEGILLAGRNDDNWFHWLIEYLPRALMVPESLDGQVPFIVSSRTPGTGLEALAELSDRPIVIVDTQRAQRVDTLHVVAPPVQVLDTTRVPWRTGLRMNVPVLHELRDRWRAADAAPPTRRIFLQRRSRHRGLTNEAALEHTARRHGLEVIDPGALSFAQQRELFSSASLLVGASGAVMANYIMMQPGSEVIALTSDQLLDFVLPAALALAAGASFTYLSGPSTLALADVVDRNHWIHADFTIDPNIFDDLLARTVKRMDAS